MTHRTRAAAILKIRSRYDVCVDRPVTQNYLRPVDKDGQRLRNLTDEGMGMERADIGSKMIAPLRIWYFVCALALCLGGANLRAATPPHYVFAHYMVCLPSYGTTLDDFKQEIQAAQAAGLDGFALNEGTWTNDYYSNYTALIFQAAQELGTGFKLFFSIDFGGGSNDTYSIGVVNAIVQQYGHHPNYFQYQGKSVLSSYSTHGLPWKDGILTPLAQAGYPVFFVPYFEMTNWESWPNTSQVAATYNLYSNVVDGMFYFGASGLTTPLTNANLAYVQASRAAGKLCMGSFSPSYWGIKQYSAKRRYYEADGGEGIEARWMALINSQPDWVEICTWNDMDEGTYVSPVASPSTANPYLGAPTRWSHNGYLELSKHFISWYKNGQEPPLTQDALYYFYRTHPLAAVPSDTNDVICQWWEGTYDDSLYTTVYLTAPAELDVVSGSGGSTNVLPAGRSHVRTPFLPGPQTMTIRRQGNVVLTVQGTPDIQAQIVNQDLLSTTGFAYASSNSTNNSPSSTNNLPAAPMNLRVVPQ